MNEQLKEKLDEVLKAVKIEDVISDYIQLKRVGKRYAGVCPFHNDRDPSLSVNSEKGFFHCFGCGVGGNAINFVMKAENISFKEALKKVASKAGIQIDISVEKSPEQIKAENIEKIIRESALFYFNNLQSGNFQNNFEYLSKRGISKETIRRFGIGCSPIGKSNLVYYLQQKGYALDDILDSGMAVKYDDGNISDCFRGRITIPIVNYLGKFVAMGGRTLDSNYSKYINSQETAIFSKGKNFFGLNLSKAYIQKKNCAIVVEGYFDMISLWQHGINNACASMGTSLTSMQASLLRKFTSNVILMYDSDSAGKSASDRNLEIFYNVGITPKVAILPEGYDPDLFVREFGNEGIDKILENSLDIMDFYISELKEKYDLTTPTGKSEFANKTLAHLIQLNDPVIVSEYIKKISEESQTSEEVLRKMISGKTEIAPKNFFKNSNTSSVEEKILSMLLHYPKLLPEVEDIMNSVTFKDKNLKKIYDILITLNPNTPLTMEDFSAYAEEEGLINKIIELLIFENSGIDNEDSAKIFIDELKEKLSDMFLREKFAVIKKEVEEALINNTIDRNDERFIEYQRLYRHFKGRKT